jgi:hypothetical protein
MSQCITVKDVSVLLGKKFQPFITGNNLEGAVTDLDRELSLDRLSDNALLIASSVYLTEDEYRLYTHRIFDLSSGTMNLYKSRAFIKRILGYSINSDIPVVDGKMYNMMFKIPEGVEHPLTYSNRRVFEDHVATLPADSLVRSTVNYCKELPALSKGEATSLAHQLRSLTGFKLKLGYGFNHIAQWLGYKDWRVVSEMLKSSESVPRIHHGV